MVEVDGLVLVACFLREEVRDVERQGLEGGVCDLLLCSKSHVLTRIHRKAWNVGFLRSEDLKLD